MAKPYRENLAQSERDRTKAREMIIGKRGPDYGLVDEYHFTPPSVSMLTISDISSAIRESAQFAEMQRIYTSGEILGMGIGHGAVGGAYLPTPKEYQYIQERPEAPPVEDQYIVTSPRELNGLKAALEAANKAIAERDEIIEALAADLEDIDALREENARLRIICETYPKSVLKSGWTPWEGGACPVSSSTKVAVEIEGWDRDSTHGREASVWNWGRSGSVEPITAYRIVE